MPIPFDEQPQDAASILEVLESILPAEWWEPMKLTPDAGYELLQAAAAVGERVMLAAFRVRVGLFAAHAQGGLKARVFVELYRPNAAAGAVTVLRGSIVATSRSDRRFVTLEDVVFGIGVVGPLQVEVEAVAMGWEWNVDGQRITKGGETLPGEIDSFRRLVTEPAHGDPTIQVRQVLDVHVEGRAPMLDAVAEDRGIKRSPNETDDQLSVRARTLPDTISPGAVRRMLLELLGSRGVPYDFIEVFEHRYQECWDAPSPNPDTPTYQPVMPTNPDYDPNLFCYDDPRSPDPFRNRWLDDVDWRGAFIVVVPTSLTIHDLGMALDDPGMTPLAFHPAGGPSATVPWRATPAYDAPVGLPLVYAPALDGYDVERGALYAALARQLEAIRAAGIVAAVETTGV